MSFVCDHEKLAWIEWKRIGEANFWYNPVNIDAVRDLIWIDLKQISEALNISYECVHRIVYVDLAVRQIFAKLIPRCLHVDQKQAMEEASLGFKEIHTP